MKQKKASKALRVGVIYSGRLLEEKLFRKPETISVGSSHKNGIILPIGEKPIPKKFNLFVFDPKEGRYYLRFIPGAVKGSITLNKQVIKLEELARSKEAKKSKNEILYPLPGEARGKISMGETLILFLFVAAPPPLAKPRLPSSMRGGWVRSIDWPFVTLFMIVLILESLIIGFSAREAELQTAAPTTKEDMKRFVDNLLMKEPEPEPEPEEMQDEGQGVAQKEEKGPSKDAGEKRPKTKEERKAAAKEAAVNKAEAASQRAQDILKIAMGKKSDATLKAIMMASDSGSASDLVMNVAADDGGDSGLSAEMLNDIKSVKQGANTRRVNVDAIGGGTKEIGGNIDAKAGGNSKLTAKQTVRRKHGRIGKGTAQLTGSGFLDQKTIIGGLKKQVFKKVQRCYEVLLAQAGDVKGTVTVVFVIDKNGKVKKVSIDSGRTTLKDAGLQMCVKLAVKRMTFAQKPEGGEVTASYPFNFSAD